MQMIWLYYHGQVVGLQNCLNSVPDQENLKLWFFKDEPKKYDCDFYIGNEKIDIVQNYAYLGTQFS